MESSRSRVVRSVFGAFGVVSLGVALWGQEGNVVRPDGPLVTDWTHHHLVYSAPDLTSLPAELRLEPRYWQQWLRHNWKSEETGEVKDHGRPHQQPKRFKRDWSVSLGTGATVGAGMFPAKFSFSASTAHCASDANPDFVAFNTSVAGSATQATIVAFDNLYVGCLGTVPSTYWAYNTGGKVVTSSVLSV